VTTTETDHISQASVQLRHSTIPTPHGDIAVAEAGQGAALVMLHGGGPGASGVSNYHQNLTALTQNFRVVLPDQPGFGDSYRPTEGDLEAASITQITVDALFEALDELGIERVHFLGSSWGARLGFALGEHAPERVLSLVLCGNQPYDWDLESPTAQAVAAAISASREGGMGGFVEAFESTLAYRFPEPDRTWTIEKNDPLALEAAWRSLRAEGPVSQDLTAWRVPCLICAGEADEMHDAASRAAAEIPSARFVSLAGHSHISAFYEADDLLLPHILELLRSAAPTG